MCKMEMSDWVRDVPWPIGWLSVSTQTSMHRNYRIPCSYSLYDRNSASEVIGYYLRPRSALLNGQKRDHSAQN